MTTRQLYYLVTISEIGNLSRAAEVLGISQPALSKFLTEYENSLGFLLFLRYHRQLTPTAVGRYVIECAQRILDEQTRMLQTLRSMSDSNRSLIRLATAPNRAAIIYSRIYNQFARRYPDISLSLTELYASEQPGAIQHGQIDLAIGAGKVSSKVTDLPFAEEELLVSLPASHPMSWAGRIRLSDLKDTPFVLQGPRHSIRLLADELFRKAGFDPVVAFESNDVLLVDSMLHQAVGAGLVSKAHVFPCSDLVYRPLDPPVCQHLHIRYPLGHTLTAPERYLAGLLIHERLSDSRYHAVPSAEVEALLRTLDSDTDGTFPLTQAAESAAWVPFTGAAGHAAPELNLNTDVLRYLIAIVDEKSLTRAAEKYYLTQPALSRHLRNVEQMLCTRLFTRIHNRLQPTNAGKVFANFARNILMIEEEMSEHIRQYRKGHGGGLHLYCDPLLAKTVRNRVLEPFRNLHPDVALYITESSREDTQEALLNASADFGLYFSCEETHPVLDCRILAESELVYSPGPKLQDSSVTFPDSRPLMLVSNCSSLRFEQNRILTEIINMKDPQIVCEASLSILQLLSEQEAADTILPREYLPAAERARCRTFNPPQHYFLLMSCHPARTFPPSAGDLIRLLNCVFETYYQGNFLGTSDV